MLKYVNDVRMGVFTVVSDTSLGEAVRDPTQGHKFFIFECIDPLHSAPWSPIKPEPIFHLLNQGAA